MFVFNTNMKITNINSPVIYRNRFSKKKENKSFDTTSNGYLSFGRTTSFFNFFIPHKPTQSEEYKQRIAKLKEEEIDDIYAQEIANLGDEDYKKALQLMEQGIYEQSIFHVAKLDEKKFAQAQKLIKMGIIDENLAGLANNKEKIFSRISDLREKGLHIDYLNLYKKLTEKQYKEAIDLIQKGYPQNIAAYLVQLNSDKQNLFYQLISDGEYPHLAFEITKQKKRIQNRTLSYMKQGMSAANAIDIAELRKGARKRADELIPLNIGDMNIANFANLGTKDRKKALFLFKQGVLPEYITDIILVEKGMLKNEDYKKYLKKGYSPSMAYAISLLSKEEREQLKNLEQKFPEIKELYKDNYDINIIENQLTDEEDDEAIFSKDIRTKNGTLITIVKTFSEDGTVTTSRTEEYTDKTTSSIMANGNRTIRASYDKYGQVDEMLHILHNQEDSSVEGAIYSKASKILSGVFDSIYYDISDFRQDESNDEKAMDLDISQMVSGEGIQISKATRLPDGKIVFTEEYTTNECTSKREYEEKKDEFGNIIENYYSYKITNDDGTVLMSVVRRRERNRDGSITETINGNDYNLTFDDEKKTVTISDKKNTKVLDFEEMLPFYSREVFWNTIKNQSVDNLLVISENTKRWINCYDQDSQIYNHIAEICTGKDTSVVSHEVGHLIQKSNPLLSENEDFLASYNQEMMNFMTNFPYNEQEHIQYFTPRAELLSALGYEEFISETNLLLNTYGASIPSLTVRSQILSRYFPKTIAIVATMLGKTSEKSLLEEHV